MYDNGTSSTYTIIYITVTGTTALQNIDKQYI